MSSAVIEHELDAMHAQRDGGRTEIAVAAADLTAALHEQLGEFPALRLALHRHRARR